MDNKIDYNIVLLEFDSFSEDEKEANVYACLGYAVYLAQNIEKLLINMILANKILNDEEPDVKEVVAFCDNYELGKRTMGRLSFEMKKLYHLTDIETDELNKILKLRNYIVHDYFKFNTKLLYSQSGLKIILKDFLDFINLANSLENKLDKYVFRYLEKLGYSLEKYKEAVEKETMVWSNLNFDDDYKSILK